MTYRQVLVTGATGGIGPALVNQLAASGYIVRTYSRQMPAPNLFIGDVEHIQGDIRDERMLAQSLHGVDVVFHLAALLHIENPAPGMAHLYHEINVNGTQHVVSLAAQASVRQFVYFSTVKVYGIHRREPVSEVMVPNPKTIYAQTKLRGEQLALSTNNLETIVLRLSAVYGPRLRGSWERMIRAIAKGRFVPIGKLQNQRSLTYVDDVARAARVVIERSDAAGNIYNVVGYEAVTMREILSCIYAALNKTMPPVHIPSFAALAGIQLLDTTLELIHKRSPLTTEAVQQLVTDEVYSGTKLRTLGWETFTPLDRGWKQAITELTKY